MPDASPPRPSLATDYACLAAAIASLPENSRQSLELAALAHAASLHEPDLLALLQRWAGGNPEQFLRSLTLEAVRARLAASQTQFRAVAASQQTAALPVQLVTWPPDGSAPTDRHWSITYGWHDTRFGKALIATSQWGLCTLQFCDAQDDQTDLRGLQKRWPEVSLHHDPQQTQPLSDRLNQTVDSSAVGEPLPLVVRGTPFQIEVWQALLMVPSGRLATYQDVASYLGNPRAARAVGMAIGANPVAYWIPCHRVVQATGALGGYRWGVSRKTLMLAWEACQQPEDDSWLPCK